MTENKGRWLTGWKSIAEHLDVSVRTARRMAWKGMPVMWEGYSPVAWSADIDVWRRGKLGQIGPNEAMRKNLLARTP